MRTTTARQRRSEGGFSMVELMIGMTIGLIAVVIIIQVISVFSAQRRTTSGTADAQSNGGIALFSIQRDAQMAGFGLIPLTNPALSCTTVTYGGTGVTGIAPIVITDGTASTGVSASDTITIRYGSGQTGGVVSQITAMVGNAATVGSNLGCAVGDATLVSSGASCAVSTATAVSASGVSPISVTLGDTTLAGSGANLACLGTWNEVTYAANATTGDLDRTSRVNGTATTAPSVVGIVNVQAQYGISASASSNQITGWVDATGTWAAPSVADRNRIKAIRVAVIARNAQQEAGNVTTACSSTTAASPTGLCAWEGSAASPAPTVDLSQGDANWAKYRYRVFETIIPMRNVIWARGSL